ncbi:MAG: InlB B-repeat-containing protein [Clostridia bacterium]|nr:InlB B-repeat-containing protein [Clostridia bacterium]
MKTIRLIALVLIVLSLALAFASCGGGSGGGADGTYYRYENGKTLSDDWIKLDGKNWSADDETSGRYEQKGNALTFYSTIFGEEEEVWTATLKDGKLTVEFMGETFVYYKKGTAPTSGGNDPAGKGTTTAATCQITYDANGGAFADGKTTLTVTERENAALTAPDSPVRDNYTFAGWAKQKKGTDLWDFASDKATGNTTLYATWKEKSASILSMDGATIDGNSIFLFVDRNTESVSLSGKVVCSSDSIWKFYYDKLGQVEIPTKIAAGMDGELDDGDNVFYIVVTSNDGTQVNVYDLTVHRSYQVAIRYYNGTDLLKTETAYTGSTYTTGYRPEITGYTFNRWKTKTGAAAESAFTIWDEQSFYADKTAKTYTVTLDVNGGDPLSQATKTVTYDAAYSLGKPTRTGHSFVGWTVGGTLVTDASGTALAEWTYDGDRTLRASWSINTYLRDGDYIYFGEYPQTVKANDVTITATQDARGYYLGSDGAYYAKVTATPYTSGYTFSTGATVSSGTVYYFKVEPIKWRILSESDGVALILCDSIIDNHVYNNSTSTRTINGQTVYPNNYKESDIRAWLNGQFYETAFSELQRKLILTTTMDNSARSTNPNNDATWSNNGTNTYACANTQDKVFLLSVQEVTNSAYGFNTSYSYDDTARRKVTSDYNRATGAYMNTSADYFGNAWWWLRSPIYYGSSNARDVDPEGHAGNHCSVSSYIGVVPALRIQL